MKHLSICLLLTGILFACHKDEKTPNTEPIPVVEPIIELGKIAYKKDGVPVEVVSNTYLHPNLLYFAFYHFTNKQTLEERFTLSKIPCKVGTYTIKEDNHHTINGIPIAILGWVVDGDQNIGGLFPNDSYKGFNYVEVLRYDSIQNIAEGIFQVALKNFEVNSLSSVGLKDSMRITEGRFHLKLK